MNKLITIPISHYCEKARWALDRAGLPYRERAHMQCLHWVAVKRAGGGRTVPVLVTEDGVLSESSDILDYANARAPADRRLYPEDAGLEQATRALERDFDARLGPQGRRWLYDGILDRRDLVKTYGPTGVPGWQRAALPVAIAPVKRIINRYLDITPETVEAVSARRTRDLRRGRGAAGRRPSLPHGRPLQRRRPHLLRALCADHRSAGVRRPPAGTGRAPGADGRGRP